MNSFTGPTDEFKWTYQLDGTRMTTINALDPNVKYVYLTQGFKGRYLRILVKRYDPQPNTDVLHYRWRSATKGEQTLNCEPYAISNVDQATKAINDFLDDNIDAYLSGALEGKSQVLRDIFVMARRKYEWARVRLSSLCIAALTDERTEEQQARLVLSRSPTLGCVPLHREPLGNNRTRNARYASKHRPGESLLQKDSSPSCYGQPNRPNRDCKSLAKA
jgi:hypothetical protein